jgi:hypothetical protein
LGHLLSESYANQRVTRHSVLRLAIEFVSFYFASRTVYARFRGGSGAKVQ